MSVGGFYYFVNILDQLVQGNFILMENEKNKKSEGEKEKKRSRQHHRPSTRLVEFLALECRS